MPPALPSIDLLLIGYGNELRSDDGVGPQVVSAVEQLRLPGVQTLTCHQLAPELAETIARANRVVFVDAAVDAPDEVQLRELAPAETGRLLGHAPDPRTMLALARDVFGHCPAAWWLTIPIETAEFGTKLSAKAIAGLNTAVEKIRVLAARKM